MNSDPYGKSARWYDTFTEPFNAGLRRLAMKLWPPRQGMAVLDIGCGTGAHLSLYEKEGCEVYGIDTSPAMLELARRKLGEHAVLHLGDASEMPFPSDSFDLVLAMLALHEMPPSTRAAIMDEAKRVVKKDGRLLLIDYHPGPIKFPKGWFFKSVTTFFEIVAGMEHFKNYRGFLSIGGLHYMSEEHQLMIEKKVIVSGGNLGLFLLRLE